MLCYWENQGLLFVFIVIWNIVFRIFLWRRFKVLINELLDWMFQSTLTKHGRLQCFYDKAEIIEENIIFGIESLGCHAIV